MSFRSLSPISPFPLPPVLDSVDLPRIRRLGALPKTPPGGRVFGRALRSVGNPSRRLVLAFAAAALATLGPAQGTVPPPGGGSSTQRLSLTQFGITWTFDQAYPTGRFANGDWWVVGPVTVVGIDPPSTQSGGRTMNGSMVNPSPSAPVIAVPGVGTVTGLSQGYDSAMYGGYTQPGYYQSALNVALGVSPSNPLVLPVHSSLVSTISVAAAGASQQLQTAAVLTVLPAPAPPGSFRPAYCGSDKTVLFNESQLQRSLLESLNPVPATPDLATLEVWFTRPWIDHVPSWAGRFLHPVENMPDYGREIANVVGEASLMLHLDFPSKTKENLLIGLVQVGIDLYRMAELGFWNHWGGSGGHASGRKWPIVFAGRMLDHGPMTNVDTSLGYFGEDAQTFFVQQSSPNVYNAGYGGYGPLHLGMPEWGMWHVENPQEDTVSWTANSYRLCCTAVAWNGYALAAHIMNARSLWGHDAFFAYMDRYMGVTAPGGTNPGWRSWSDFTEQMWDTYRANYQPLPGVLTFGTSTAGCAGVLEIGVTSPPQLGNSAFAITCTNTPANLAPGQKGLLLLSWSAAPAPIPIFGASLWLDLTPGLFLGKASAGAQADSALVSVPLPIPSIPSWAGAKFYAQFGWPDTCASGGVSASNALAVTLQP